MELVHYADSCRLIIAVYRVQPVLIACGNCIAQIGTDTPFSYRQMVPIFIFTVILLLSEGTKRPMYLKRNITARSFIHCCSGKAINDTYCECVFTALGTRHSMRMRCSVICGLPCCTVFLHIIL